MTASLARLIAPKAPFFHMLQGASDVFDTQTRAISELPGATLRILEGENATTLNDLLHCLEEALELPEYFTNNWDSLDECLSDLEWLPTRNVVLAIRDVSELLSEEEDEMEIFAEILWTTGEAWAEASEPNLPMSFHIVLHDQFNGLEPWVHELKGLGADFDKL